MGVGKKVPIVGKVKGEEGTVMESVPERKDIQDFEARIGRTQVMASAAGVGGSKQQQAGFYCEICNMTLKDNVGYLDHVNGRQHMILAGVSLQTERSSVEDVRERLAWLKRKKDNPDVAYGMFLRSGRFGEEMLTLLIYRYRSNCRQGAGGRKG